MRTVITSARLLTPERIIDHPIIAVEDGYIVSIESASSKDMPSSASHLHYDGATLVPALFDVHIHGGKGHDVMDATADTLDAVGMFLASRGVGSYFPTTVTGSEEKILRALEGLAQQVERASHPGAKPLGIHLEGPFLSCEKRGVHPPEYLQEPSISLFDRFFQAARGHIALMTIAPELPNALELIAHAAQKGVRISLGHSNAHTKAALAGVATGAHSATHTFNAMRTLDHRDPGLLGVVLDQKDLFAEIICDAIHVDPIAVRLFWRAKGPHHSILVTDAMSATGMPDGTYKLGSLEVTVSNGTCLSGGHLAGSVLTMDKAMQNLMAFTGCDLQAALRCATVNPGRMTGLEKQLGTLQLGMPADITVLTAQNTVQATILHGAPITSS